MKQNPIFLFHNAGRFISRGHGRHPSRTIHSHELIYVLSGTLDMFEEDREFHLKKGERLLLFPERRHGGLSAYSPELSFFWMHFTPAEEEARNALRTSPQQLPVRDPEAFVAFCNLLLLEQKSELSGIAPDPQNGDLPPGTASRTRPPAPDRRGRPFHPAAFRRGNLHLAHCGTAPVPSRLSRQNLRGTPSLHHRRRHPEKTHRPCMPSAGALHDVDQADRLRIRIQRSLSFPQTVFPRVFHHSPRVSETPHRRSCQYRMTGVLKQDLYDSCIQNKSSVNTDNAEELFL